MILKFILLLFLTLPLTSTDIVFENIEEVVYRHNSFQYIIKAKKKVEQYKKDSKTLFLNRKKYISENFYYEDGSVTNKIKNYSMRFKRMFIYGQNLYMKEVEGTFFKYKFHAKEAVIYKDKILFRHIFFESSTHKRGSRLKFIYYFDKKNEI